MPYIGKSPVGGGFHKLDNLTASATATYALTLGGAAYYPETANQLLVSLNGVIQAPQDSFTVSGSNLVFDSALTASDSIDFVVALGDVLGVGTPTDGTITTAKIANNAVTMDKLATSGTLPALDGSALTGVGGGAGSVAQIKFTQFTGTNTISMSANTNTAFNDLAVNITPTASNSIIKLEAHVFGEHGVANDNNWNNVWFFYRDTTKLSHAATGSINVGISATMSSLQSNADSSPEALYYGYFDAPSSTSQITYKVGANVVAAQTFHLNKAAGVGTTIAYERGISFISATEILQ
tara:strand:+ start:1159 stop:2043 length:885 start_codon:yes stop_codon:yes gene_type:complete